MKRRLAAFASLLLAPLLLGADDPRILRGEMRLEKYQFRLAIGLFQGALAEHPDSVRAKRGLGIAFARQKRCDDGLPLLAEVRPAPEWDADAAIAEGDCHKRGGDVASGIAAFEEALLFEPESGEALYQLLLARHEAGDEAGVADALDALEDLDSPRAANLRPLAEAWLALDAGGDEAWLALHALRRQVEEAAQVTNTARIEASVIEGQLWLDAGDPVAAAGVLAKAGRMSRVPTRASSWRAEALRRAGSPEEALAIFDSPKLEIGDLPIKGAVLARIAVDQGRLEDARTLLAGADDPEDPDVLASGWYIARAARDDVAMAAYESRWRRANLTRDRRLEQLIPWQEGP